MLLSVFRASARERGRPGATGSSGTSYYWYLFLQGLAKIGGANYWNFATSPLVWSLELKLAPRFKMNELGEISSEI